MLFIAASCKKNNQRADAYGNFEAKETVISSQTPGMIIKCNIEEGEELNVGDTAYICDPYSYKLQKEQILTQKSAVSSKFSGILAQVDVLNKQKEVLLKEEERIQKLLKDNAATQKQLDDITGKIDILEKQILQVKTQHQNLFDELKVFDSQINTVNDYIHKTRIINPIKGRVLVKYAEQYEITAPGKPLYKIADLSEIILRAYISGSQLNEIQIGQTVSVFIDNSENNTKKYSGKITWISDKAEFTPKIIQTKEERVNLVYAVKIKVINDGSIKIGMPGEIKFK
jgi:HlyD family secretion protein